MNANATAIILQNDDMAHGDAIFRFKSIYDIVIVQHDDDTFEVIHNSKMEWTGVATREAMELVKSQFNIEVDYYNDSNDSNDSNDANKSDQVINMDMEEAIEKAKAIVKSMLGEDFNEEILEQAVNATRAQIEEIIPNEVVHESSEDKVEPSFQDKLEDLILDEMQNGRVTNRYDILSTFNKALTGAINRKNEEPKEPKELEDAELEDALNIIKDRLESKFNSAKEFIPHGFSDLFRH